MNQLLTKQPHLRIDWIAKWITLYLPNDDRSSGRTPGVAVFQYERQHEEVSSRSRPSAKNQVICLWVRCRNYNHRLLNGESKSVIKTCFNLKNSNFILTPTCVRDTTERFRWAGTPFVENETSEHFEQVHRGWHITSPTESGKSELERSRIALADSTSLSTTAQNNSSNPDEFVR